MPGIVLGGNKTDEIITGEGYGRYSLSMLRLVALQLKEFVGA